MTLIEQYRFSGEKVLVTGARGFIGSHLCDRLLRNGAELHAVSRKSKDSLPEQIRVWVGSLSDLSFVGKIVSEVKPDYIFHLSGFVSGLRDAQYVIESYHSLLTSTVNLLTVATKTGCKKIVLAGSLEEPDEVSPVPSSPYAAAKWACRGYERMYHALYGTPVVNPRIFMVYGPGQREIRKLIPYVILSLLRNEVPKLSSGRRAIDWVFIDDVVDGLIHLAKNETFDRVDIGTGCTTTVKEIVEKLVAITGSDKRPVFGDLEERPLERVASADSENTFEKTGWKPVMSIDEGLRQTVSWYKDHLGEFGT